jgi:transcriptional regulator with XRE-family HTH domain
MLDRIKEIMQQKGLNPSAFADAIQVQRSSISHILNGRNKPSLELVQKIISAFPDIDIEWLLTGQVSEKIKPSVQKEECNLQETEPKAISQCFNTNEDDIEKIVLFYKNGSFKIYQPK